MFEMVPMVKIGLVELALEVKKVMLEADLSILRFDQHFVRYYLYRSVEVVQAEQNQLLEVFIQVVHLAWRLTWRINLVVGEVQLLGLHLEVLLT